jgi:glutamate-1-semialdehyde aminotransferase
VHFTDAPVHDARAAVAAARAAGPVPRCLHLALLVRGIAASGRLMFCTSTAMANAEVDAACDALADALAALRDGIAAERPALLR